MGRFPAQTAGFPNRHRRTARYLRVPMLILVVLAVLLASACALAFGLASRQIRGVVEQRDPHERPRAGARGLSS